MEIKNMSWSPLTISLPDGKSVTLSARGTSEIGAEDFQSSECQRLFNAQAIIVLPRRTEERAAGAPVAGSERAPATETRSNKRQDRLPGNPEGTGETTRQ